MPCHWSTAATPPGEARAGSHQEGGAGRPVSQGLVGWESALCGLTAVPWCRNQRCRLAQEGKCCAQGLRLRHHYMLCGALLRVWGRIAAVMADVSSSSYLQIVRLKTKDKKKQVGECGSGCGVPGGRVPKYVPQADLTACPRRHRHQDPRGMRSPCTARTAADGCGSEAPQHPWVGGASTHSTRRHYAPLRSWGGAGPDLQSPSRGFPSASTLRLPVAAAPRPQLSDAGCQRPCHQPCGAGAPGLRHQLQGSVGRHAPLLACRAHRNPCASGGRGWRRHRAAERHPLQPALPKLLGCYFSLWITTVLGSEACGLLCKRRFP